jgi:hypothetical protein
MILYVICTVLKKTMKNNSLLSAQDIEQHGHPATQRARIQHPDEGKHWSETRHFSVSKLL